MSKTHKRQQEFGASTVMAPLSHEAEYRIIKHDIIRVVILNVIYLGAVLALYYSNKQSHFLEAWFSKLFNF